LSSEMNGGAVKPLTPERMVTAYGDWLLDEAAREAESGCARMRRVRDRFTAYFLEQTEGWPAGEVATLLRARIKVNRKASLTQDEKRLAAAIEWPVVSPDAMGRTKVVWQLNRGIATGEFKIDRNALRREVRAHLDGRFGKPVQPSGTVRYLTAVGDVLVCTDVDYPTKLGQLRYWQSVFPKADTQRGVSAGYFDSKLLLHTSFYHVAGLHMDTTWSCLTNEEIPAAAETLADLCSGFIEELPKIIDAARA
jgi:hypothetical protein